jgi:hypothetical protein
MQISVTKTMRGAPDGVHTQTYVAGVTYDMPDDLGAVFVRERWGKAVQAPAPPPSGPSGPSAPGPDGGDGHKGGKGPDENK